jgi:hypothetical protein
MLPLILLLVLPSFLVFYNFYWKRRGLPPGPTPLPLLGNALDLVKYAPGYKAFENWKGQFGPIYTFWLGEDPIVVLADYEVMKETFIRDGDSYTGTYLLELLNPLFTGIKVSMSKKRLLQYQRQNCLWVLTLIDEFKQTPQRS